MLIGWKCGLVQTGTVTITVGGTVGGTKAPGTTTNDGLPGTVTIELDGMLTGTQVTGI